jgi:spermidine synthase
MAWLVLIGALSTIAQVVLLREIHVAFYGVELVYLLAIGVWLFWTGAGAASDRGRLEPPSASAIGALLLALAAVLPLDVAFLRASRHLAGAVTGAYVDFPRQMLILVGALLPVGMLLGLLFQWAARRALSRGRTLAAAYAVESAGALAGGLATLAWTRAGLPTLGLAMSVSAICLLACLGARPVLSRGLRLGAATLGGVLVVLLAGVDVLDRMMTGWSHPLLVATRDSPYGRITVSRAANQVAVFENDALSFETGGTDAELLAHVAALSHPRPARMLLLGGGPEGVARELLLHRPEQLDSVELNALLLQMTRQFAPESLPTSGDQGVRLIIADPRRFLLDADRYDVIVVSAPGPDSGQANRFYTREFFAACARALRDDGVLAFRLHTAENVWTPAQALRFASVDRALRRSLPHVIVLPGATNVVLASRAELPQTADPLVQRYDERGLRARLVGPALLRYLFSNDRRAEIEATLGRTEAPMNTDAEPACYRYALVLWMGRFWPALATFDPHSPEGTRLGRSAGWAALILLLMVLWWTRRRPAWRGPTFVGLAALAGMLLESVVLLHYQVTQGVVYQDIGLLIAAFMAGLAAGTWIVSLRLRALGTGRRAGLGIAGLLVLAGPAVATSVAAGGAMPLPVASLLLAAIGGLVGAAFGWASRPHTAGQRAAIAPLYAADLIGGGVGAVLGGLVLIPVAGLAVTAAIASLVAVAALGLV